MNRRNSDLGVSMFFSPRVWRLLLPFGISMMLGQEYGRGQGTTYTSSSAFNAALAASTTITFESLTPSTPSSLGMSPVSVSGVTFTNADSRLFITSSTTGVYPIPGTGQYLWNFDAGSPVGIYLPGGVTGFGADFSGGITPQTNFNATLTTILAGGQSYTYNFSGPLGAWVFFGVTYSVPIVSLVYNDGGQAFPGTHEEMLDNVSFGVAIPEPCGSGLVVFGLLAALGFRQTSRHLEARAGSREPERKR